MNTKPWIIGGLSAALVIAVGGFVLTQLPVAAPTTASGSSTSATPGTKTPSASGSTPPAPATGQPEAGAAEPPAVGKRYSTEVLPPSTATEKGLPQTKALPQPVSAPLPKSASAVGSLASGYPADTVPAAPESKISKSSVASQSSHLQVTLNAKTSQGVTDVVAFYRAALAKYGMYDSPAPAQNGATAVTFTRDANSVTLTATPASGGTSYVLFGTFTVKG
jgi:hypothetical protein